MKISEIKSTTNTSKIKKKKADTGSEFNNLMGVDETKGAGLVSESITVNTNPISLDTLNILSSLGDKNFSKKQGIDWSKDIIEELESLRNAILLGRVSYNTLQNIEQKLENLPYDIQDEELGNIIDEISVRASVELAKIERLHGSKKNNQKS